MTERVYVLLPAYNESEVLEKLIPAIGKELRPRFDFTVVVVDDGSSDRTAAVCDSLKQEWPVQLLRHPKNKGYGAAIKTGTLWIIQQASDQDLSVSLDADFTHLPEFIPSLIQKLASGFDVVTASYRMPGGAAQGVSWDRWLMSYVINRLFQWRLPENHTTCMTNGFRAYRVAILKKAYAQWGDALIRHPGFPGGLELFINVLSAGGRDTEVPFTLHYDNQRRPQQDPHSSHD